MPACRCDGSSETWHQELCDRPQTGTMSKTALEAKAFGKASQAFACEILWSDCQDRAAPNATMAAASHRFGVTAYAVDLSATTPQDKMRSLLRNIEL